MIELAALKALGLAKDFAAWVRTLPWYVIALVLAVGVAVYERHEAISREAELETARTDAAGWKTAHETDLATISTLRASITSQNASIDNFKEQAADAQSRATQEMGKAVIAGADRETAIAKLRQAQMHALLNDCAAPSAHLNAKDQL